MARRQLNSGHLQGPGAHAMNVPTIRRVTREIKELQAFGPVDLFIVSDADWMRISDESPFAGGPHDPFGELKKTICGARIVRTSDLVSM